MFNEIRIAITERQKGPLIKKKKSHCFKRLHKSYVNIQK